MDKPVILIAERGNGVPQGLDERLLGQGFKVLTASDATSALRVFRAGEPNLVILGCPPDASCDPLLPARQIRQLDRHVPIILLPSRSTEDLAIAALRAGIDDYLQPPVSQDQVEQAVARCLRLVVRESRRPPGPLLGASAAFERMIGDSTVMRGLKVQLLKIAGADCNVLITGETGSGKELAAEVIHENSPRAREPFVRINCAAIPDTLLESELFGHEKGAYTGADSLREGMLKTAGKGTVLLDEVGDLSSAGQAKILRAVETKEIRRLGAKGSTSLEVRVIAATNRDLEQLVSEGKFRQDLYFRLNVARVNIPPLRERREDMPLLLAHYLRETARRIPQGPEGFSDEALDSLLCCDWPGNIRELKNVVEVSVLNAPGKAISFCDLPEHFRNRLRDIRVTPPDEKDRLLLALFSTKWNKSEAAQKLRWSRMTLYRKMAKYQIKDIQSA